MRTSITLGILSFAAVITAAAAGVRSMPVPPVYLERQADAPGVVQGQLDWRGRYSPADERDRLVATVDRGPARPLQASGAEGIALPSEPLSPGLHFVELSMERRGGRITRITDEIWAGPWQSDHPRGCDVGLTLTSEGLRDLLLPVVEAKLLAGARQNPYFGSTSALTRKELEVVDGGLRFSVFLDTDEEDKGDLSVAGIIEVKAQGDAEITARLRSLEEAAPGPKLEALARAEGRRRLGTIGAALGGGLVAVAGGGALLGAAVAMGGGYLGSELGEGVGERTARREVRREAAVQIEQALRVATDALRLPDGVVVLPTEPALVADLRWCGEPSLSAEAGLRASLRVVLRDDAVSEQAAAQAVFLDTTLPEPSGPREPGANLHVDVSTDLVNRLLAEWVVRGGLGASLDASGLQAEVQAALGERTRWRVQALGVERSPIVEPRAGDRIEASLGGVTLELHDPDRAGVRTVVLGATGSLTLEPLPEPGRVRLGGELDQVYFGCRSTRGALERRLPCFSSAVDPRSLRELLGTQLRERSNQLPVLDLGAVLRLRLFGEGEPRPVELSATWVKAEQGCLSIDAQIR